MMPKVILYRVCSGTIVPRICQLSARVGKERSGTPSHPMCSCDLQVGSLASVTMVDCAPSPPWPAGSLIQGLRNVQKWCDASRQTGRNESGSMHETDDV